MSAQADIPVVSGTGDPMNRKVLGRDASRERAMFLSLSLPALLLVGICAMLPILWIVRQSLTTFDGTFTLAHYQGVLGSALTWNALQTTVVLAGGTLAICIALGLPLALTLASAPPKIANRLLIFIMLPLWTSILVRTYGWLVLLRRDGLINEGLMGLGLTDAPLNLVYNFTGTMIGMVHYMLPLFVLPVYGAMRDICPNTVRAAASMGASLPRTVLTIILPLARGGIASGSIIVFIYTLGFFITPAILGGGRVSPIAIRIDRALSVFQDWGQASALGILLLILIALSAVMIFGMRSLLARKEA